MYVKRSDNMSTSENMSKALLQEMTYNLRHSMRVRHFTRGVHEIPCQKRHISIKDVGENMSTYVCGKRDRP